MSSPQNSIIQWLIQLGISNLLTSQDLLSSLTLHTILKKTFPQYKNQLLIPSSAINKINNWNNIIKQLDKLNITKVTNQEKGLVMHGNQNTVYSIINQVKIAADNHNKAKESLVDINKIDHRADPKAAKSLLQLFILVIIKNLGLNAKQSVALLSNDSKYLAHILAKGFKQQPKPVMNLLRDFNQLLPQILSFCQNKQNQVFLLKSLKPGLISKFVAISQLSLTILQSFSLSSPTSPFQILKTHLLPTLVLQYRRHSTLLTNIGKTIVKLSKYNKTLIGVLISNMNGKELLSLVYQVMNIADADAMLNSKGLYAGKMDEVLAIAVDALMDSTTYSIAMLVIIKITQTNYQLIAGNKATQQTSQKLLISMLNNLQNLAIHKKPVITTFITNLFTLLSLFGLKKNPIAPLIFKLCIQKYKLTLNQDDSQLFCYNFLNLLDDFPAIPNTMIVDAITQKYDSYGKAVINQLELEILARIVYGQRNKINRDHQDNQDDGDQQYHNKPRHSTSNQNQEINHPDQKTSLKIYNFLSKLFFQDVGNTKYITDIIIYTILSHPHSRLIFDLNLKMIKVCLAVHYANIRKLNLSKSIVQGVVRLDQSNAFTKRKNLDIELFLNEILQIQNLQFNQSIQPLICYSYIQSESKNKPQTQGLYNLMKLMGNPKTLIKKYQDDVRNLHQEKRTSIPRKKLQQKQQPLRSISQSTDILNRKKLNPGENYSLYLSKISKINIDAQNGLDKYQKLRVDKLQKQKQDQLRKAQDQLKKQVLQKKYTNKILQKGIRIHPHIQSLPSYLYQFGMKQKQLKKQVFSDLTSLHLFNPNQQQSNDLQALKYVLKKYNKVLKIYYSVYGGKLRPNSISLFQELAEKNSLMQVANVWKLWKDHFLDQYMTVREAQYLVQKINAQSKKAYNDMSLLDFQTFEDFIVQASLTMFSRPPKNLSGHSISYMVQETFYRFRLYATQNKIDSRLFEDENTVIAAQNGDQSVGSLNQKLKENPDYILPQGYKKVTDKKVQFYHEVSLDAFNDSYSDVIDILDEILYDKLGIHIIEPYSQVVTNVYAKSLLSKKKQQKSQDFMEKYFSLNMKKQLSNFQSQDRIIARQVAFSLTQMVDAVQFGKKYLAQHTMKYTIKQQQEERRKLQQEELRKRQKRDKDIKKQLEKHKIQQQSKKVLTQSDKLKQQKAKEQQRKKKQKYELQLKKKVQQYQKKKQQQKRKQEDERQKQLKKEQQSFDKKRQQLMKANKIIQQKKQEQKKLKQAEQKKAQQQQALTKRARQLQTKKSPKLSSRKQKPSQKPSQKPLQKP